MNLYAISDLHLGHQTNYQALARLPFFPNDWLIVAGDIGETIAHFHYALRILTERFQQVIWVPGNHDLWTLSSAEHPDRGQAKYLRLVKLCRSYGVLTPEDPYVYWPGADFKALLVPTMTLYDYSFLATSLSREAALARAIANKVICADELVLHTDPYANMEAWCAARCEYTEERLSALSPDMPLIIINHYPLHQDMALLPHIPDFRIWCGTQRTEDWTHRFPIKLIIHGHLHIQRSSIRNGVRYEEVSLGYPGQWDQSRAIAGHLRKITLSDCQDP